MSLNWTLLPHRRSLDKAAVFDTDGCRRKAFFSSPSAQLAESALGPCLRVGKHVPLRTRCWPEQHGEEQLPFHEQPDTWPAKAGRVS